jgi:hypothetical protein
LPKNLRKGWLLGLVLLGFGLISSLFLEALNKALISKFFEGLYFVD